MSDADRPRELERARRESRLLAEDAAAARRERDEALAAMEALRASPSWRLTAPLRRVVKALRRGRGGGAGPAALPEVFGFSLEGAAAPEVSVIVPAFGPAGHTRACLRSIHDTRPRCSFEVIVVDDGIVDEVAPALAGIHGILLLKNDENLGFVRSCNRGAAAARGRFLLFLNNDTLVGPGWLDELVATFARHPDAGLVGSRLVYPDGRLQEAGGVIWGDATGLNYGTGDDPERPEYNHERDVDYCSGASIMVPAEVFRSVGGFDERYAPAYYEDVDLAFELRRRSLRVLYQPLSRVVHVGGATSGTDVTRGVKSHQETNRGRFLEKWRETLAGHGRPMQDVRAAAERAVRRRLLVIDAATPTPDRDAGSVDVVSYLSVFRSLGYGVTFIPEGDLRHAGEYTAALQRIGVECLHAPYVASVRRHLEEHGARYDLVLLYRAPTAGRHVDDVRALCPRAAVVFNTVDLHYLREERQAALAGSAAATRRAAETKALELSVIGRADCTIVLSTAERELLAREPAARGRRVAVMPLLVPVPGCAAPFAARRDVVFVGGFRHAPNVDAVRHFVAEIWPLARGRLGGARFVIVGSDPPREVLGLRGDDVVVAGHVEDLASLLAACRLTVAPLRFGAGLKGKVLTSLASGVPCVATPVAAEGGAFRDGEEVLVADGPEAFADAVVRLYADARLWDRLSVAGLAFVERHHSLAAGAKSVQRLLRELSEAGAAGERGR